MRVYGICFGVGLAVPLLLLLLREQSPEPGGPRVTDVARALHFEDHGGRFVARPPGANLLVTPARCTLQPAQGEPLTLEVVGANEDARATGRDPLAHKVHYLRGRDRSRWRTDVATYGKVAIDGVYPGVDLVYYGNERRLEYDFIVAPGADPACIALRVTGAERVAIEPAGDLVAHGRDGTLRQRRPVVYQEIDGARVRRDGEYAPRGDGTIGFDIGEYDRTLPLVIDPVVDWDMDGNAGEVGVATSINRDFSRTALSSFNDWANIDFKGGTIGAGIPPPLPEVTETGEMDVETAEQLKPAPVDGFAARAGRGSVRLNWNPAGLRGDVTYKVLRRLQSATDFAEIGTTTSTLFSDRGVVRGKTYVYTVTMVDGLGVESLASTEVTVRVR